MEANGPVLLAVAAFVVNILVIAVGGTWRLSRMEVSLRNSIARSRSEIEERQDRIYGEAIAAVREKVREVELFCRDTFVRRDGFYKVRDEMAADIKELRTELIARLERMEAKIDSHH